MKTSLSLSAYLTKLFILIFSASLLLAHLLSFITQNPCLAIKLSIGLVIIGCFTLRNKVQLPKFNWWDLAVLIFALLIAYLMSARDSLWGNPDNFHIPFTASIALNNIYPPIFPSTFDITMSNYHYGTDFIGTIFIALFNADAVTAQTMQVGFDVFLCIMSLNLLVEFFVANRLQSFLISLAITFYTSINSLEFFAREFTHISNMPLKQFLSTWLMISWTSVAHLTALMRLTSQNSVFFFAFTWIVLFIDNLENKRKQLIPLCLVAFGVYFAFPAFFYPIFAAMGLALIWELYKNRKNKPLISPQVLNIFYMMLAAYIGKILTFTGSFTNANGVKSLIISPSLEWIHWGKAYINYFYSPFYLQGLKTSFDYVHPSYYPIAPFFSSITFREFGFEALLALAIIIYQIYKKKLNYSSLLAFSAYISMTIPLLVKFLPREIETTRFLHWTKIALIIYVCINAPYFIDLLVKQFKSPLMSKIIRITIAIIIIIMLVPGMLSVLPIEGFRIVSNQSLSPETKKLISTLKEIHKTGDVCVDTLDFLHGHNISELAGFYGVGGQLYKADRITRETAINSFNPALLQELKVDYLLIKDSNHLNSKAIARAQDPELFQEIIQVNQALPSYRMFKFIAKNNELSPEIKSQLQTEYLWIVGCDLGKEYLPMKDSQGRFYAAPNKIEAIKMKDSLISSVATQNPICAFWLKEQAISPS